MPASKTASADTILVATETFAFGDDVIQAGRTRVAADHPAALANPQRFKPVDITPTLGHVEAASAAPGEKRGRS